VLYQSGFFRGGKSWIGDIEAHALPVDGMNHATSILWLGFCSSGYLDDEYPGIITPVYNATASVQYNKNYKLPARIRRFERPPGLPEQIEFLGEKGGLKQAEYKVLHTTNFQGILLPASYYFTTFSSPPLEYYGRVERVSTNLSRNSLLPQLGKRTTMVDRRLLHHRLYRTSLCYGWSKAHWPSVAELVEIHHRQKKPAAPMPPGLWGAGFVILIFAPLAVLWIKRLLLWRLGGSPGKNPHPRP
jgi:hypothetical protein